MDFILMLAAAATAGPAPLPAAPDIVVTATGRPERAQDVPAAVTSVDGERLAASGAVDIRGLDQLVPSLLVSSSSNEAGGAGARIRGVGTVGDNAGLESSVATYVDGIYRPRAGVALTELGPIARVEVDRGPQGTLFGRNASAGVIAITTAQPEFTAGGYADAGIGNYASRRIDAGLTGPVTSTLAARIDGVWFRRQGFVEDVLSGRHLDGRNRWLARGKLLFRPDDTLSVTLSLDASHRNEECCAGMYLPARNLASSTPGKSGGMVVASASSIAALIRADGGAVLDEDPGRRKVALSAGQSFRQDVSDGGAGLTIEKRLGGATLTAISGWRRNTFIKGQDADFSALDLIERPSDGSGFIRFRNLSQELRLSGTALGGRIDWLVGGYAGDERLTLQDNTRFGADMDRFASARIGALGGAFAAFPTYGFANLNGFARAYGGDAVAAAVDDVALAGTGELDRWRQHDSNQALFTHEQLHLTDRLTVTLGARWTRDRKTLDADLTSDSGCSTYLADIARLRALAAGGGPAAAATLANAVLAPLVGYPCNINALNNMVRNRATEHDWSGTGAIDYRFGRGLNLYASWSRGYKAGGFNLDRAALFNSASLATLPASSLHFKAETVTSWEVGAKLHRRWLDAALTLFDARFRNFQLNTYTGTNFLVSNIEGCRDDLGTTDSDGVAGNSACTHGAPGVISRGVEAEVTIRPRADVELGGGLTYADTRYARDLAGSPDPISGNNSLQPVLFLLPGSRLSNAPAYVATGSAAWRPRLNERLRGLVYLDIRWQSRIDTGSDLLPEKAQGAFAVVNARVGLASADDRWSVELWAQNLLDRDYVQVAFAEPFQGGGSGGLPGTAAAVTGFGTTSSQLFGAFLGEPRTWGLTVSRRF